MRIAVSAVLADCSASRTVVGRFVCLTRVRIGRRFQGSHAAGEVGEEVAPLARAQPTDHTVLYRVDHLVTGAHQVQAGRRQIGPQDARVVAAPPLDQADLCRLVRSSARSEAPRPPHRGRLITARRGPVSKALAPAFERG